ncbi:MAG: DUF4335 domain-containing protein [Cyanobacteria bacterium J06634_6]
MTIRRQYQLPNCSLVLDGLSIDPSPGSEEVMSLLVNAECRISGLERSLNGGYNFFAALVRAVSQYGQEVLSGYAHPQVIEGEPLLVHINPGDGPYHHLVVQPEIADLGDSGDGRAIDIKLSAVQLFDLTEAVDQFFGDQQTLPELEPALTPLARRFVRSEEPLSDKAIPAVLGVGGLVVATMALGLLPLPELRDPALDNQASNPAVVSPTDESSGSSEPPTGDAEPTDAPPVSELATAPDDTDSEPDVANESEDDPDSQVAALVESPDDEAEGNEAEPDELDDAEANAEADDETFERFDEFKDEESEEAIAEENSEGDSTNTVAANSSVFSDEPTADELTDFAAIRSLNGQLKQSIVSNREQPRFGNALTYRVRVDPDGTVLGYQPIGDGASQAIDETPLPKLVEEQAQSEPFADYRVVFTERGVVEVGPWFGWSFYE